MMKVQKILEGFGVPAHEIDATYGDDEQPMPFIRHSAKLPAGVGAKIKAAVKAGKLDVMVGDKGCAFRLPA